MPLLPPELGDFLVDALTEKRVCVLPNALPPELITELRKRALARTDFRPARVGRSLETASTIRNDEIAWLDKSDLSPAESELFALFEDLRSHLNRSLYLGLVDFEAHYARYEAGHFYARHVDRFSRGPGPSRAISMVLYLNENWSVSDGGELRLHLSPPVDVLPESGTLACFASDDVEHEVLPAKRERLSIAAWFRQT